MPLSVVLLLFGLAFCACSETPLRNFAVYIPYAESVYMRLGPLSSLAAMGHQIDPSDNSCTNFRGLYLNEAIRGTFPEDSHEMTVMLFKANTKSVDLPVRFSELVYFLVEMVGAEDLHLLYGLEVFRTEKNMSCRVHASESVIDRLYKQIRYFMQKLLFLTRDRAHKYCAEDFKGTTMMLADKKPIGIKLVSKTGRDLWNLDVDYGKGFDRFGINSKATIGPSLNCLGAFQEFPFNGVRLSHKDTLDLSSELPQMVYIVPIKYFKAFIEYPILQRLHHGELYEIQLNFGLGHIIGIEIVKSDKDDRVHVKYFLDSTVTEKDVKQIDYYLKRLPIFDSFTNRGYNMKRPFIHAVMRTSVTGPTMNLFPTEGEAFMLPSQYYEEGKFPKRIEDGTFIFEFKSRALTSSKKAFAFVYTGPNDSFTKTAVLHATYYGFLTKHHLVQDLLYRIVLRSTDNGKSMQYIWIMSTLPGKERADVLTIILKEMMLFLWMSIGGKPEHIELLMMHPMTLKVLKGEKVQIFSPETVDIYMKNPIEEIGTTILNMPFANKFDQFTEDVLVGDCIEDMVVLPVERNSDAKPKCSKNSEETIQTELATVAANPDVQETEASGNIYLETPWLVTHEPQMPLSYQLPESTSFLMNGDFAASRLVILISGLLKHALPTLSQIESLLRACNFAEFIGKVTVNLVGSIEISLCDSLSLKQLAQFKSLLITLFKGVVTIRNRAQRS